MATGDFVNGVVKVNGMDKAPSENLTLRLDYWTLTTAVNILPLSAGGTADTSSTVGSQSCLNKLIEIISLRGQPVIQAAPTVSGSVYTFKFAIEHTGSWEVDAADGSVVTTAGTNLVAAIKAAGVNYGFATDITLNATVAASLT